MIFRETTLAIQFIYFPGQSLALLWPRIQDGGHFYINRRLPARVNLRVYIIRTKS